MPEPQNCEQTFYPLHKTLGTYPKKTSVPAPFVVLSMRQPRTTAGSEARGRGDREGEGLASWAFLRV